MVQYQDIVLIECDFPDRTSGPHYDGSENAKLFNLMRMSI